MTTATPMLHRDRSGRHPQSIATSLKAAIFPNLRLELLEPISKSPEEDNEASELDEAEEVLGVILPPDENTALPLYPGEEALDEPAPHVTA